MRELLIVAGLLTLVGASIIDKGDLVVVPIFVYVIANLAMLVSILTRSNLNLKHMAIAIAVFAIAFLLTYRGQSSLGHRVYGVKPGMTVEQACRQMAGFPEYSGLTNAKVRGEFIAEGCLMFKDPSAAPSHNAFGVVVIKNERVANVYLLPDLTQALSATVVTVDPRLHPNCRPGPWPTTTIVVG